LSAELEAALQHLKRRAVGVFVQFVDQREVRAQTGTCLAGIAPQGPKEAARPKIS